MESERIISFRAITKLNDPKRLSRCKHDRIIVDEALWAIECEDCHEKLDPIAYLVSLSKEQVSVQFNIDRLRQVEHALKLKTRTKCHHCGKLTPINIDPSFRILP